MPSDCPHGFIPLTGDIAGRGLESKGADSKCNGNDSEPSTKPMETKPTKNSLNASTHVDLDYLIDYDNLISYFKFNNILLFNSNKNIFPAAQEVSKPGGRVMYTLPGHWGRHARRAEISNLFCTNDSRQGTL